MRLRQKCLNIDKRCNGESCFYVGTGDEMKGKLDCLVANNSPGKRLFAFIYLLIIEKICKGGIKCR